MNEKNQRKIAELREEIELGILRLIQETLEDADPDYMRELIHAYSDFINAPPTQLLSLASTEAEKPGIWRQYQFQSSDL